MDYLDAEIQWIVEQLLTMEQTRRTTNPGTSRYPKGSIAAEWIKDTDPPGRIRKVLDAVK